MYGVPEINVVRAVLPDTCVFEIVTDKRPGVVQRLKYQLQKDKGQKVKHLLLQPLTIK